MNSRPTVLSKALALGLPLTVISFMLLGVHTYTGLGQIFISAAAVTFLLSVLVLLPALLERYNHTRLVYTRKVLIQSIARKKHQQSKYYTLSRTLRQRHQLPNGIPAWITQA